MKTTVHPRERLVGLFILGAIAIAVVVVAYNASRSAGETRTFYLVLDQSYGLDKGKPVTMKGFEIGTISAIELRENDTVLVTLEIRRNFDRIKTDARVQITAPLDPVIRGGVSVDPGIASESRPDRKNLPWDPPENDANRMRDDLAHFIEQLNVVAESIQSEGVTTILGEDVHRAVLNATASLEETSENLASITNDISDLVRGINEGDRSLQDVMFGFDDSGQPRTVMQGIFGDRVQDRIDAVANERAGLGEIFFGPLVWAEVEGMAASLSTLQGNLTQVLEDAQLVLRDAQLRMDDLEPVFRAFADESTGIAEAVRNVAGVTADIREVSQAIAEEKQQIHVIATDLRQTIHHSSKVAEALRNHWLLSAFVSQEPETGYGVRPSRRPNHYGE